MSFLGYRPNLGDFQEEAWEKGLRLFPHQEGFHVDEWIPEGLIELDLDGTLINRHLGPEASLVPLWGTRRPVGLSAGGLVIPYDDPETAGPFEPIRVPWSKLQPGYDATHFCLTADVVVTLRLSDAAAMKVSDRMKNDHD